MGVAIPGGGFSEDRASGAQVIDGGLRFDSAKSHYLSRTPAAGNRKTWTWAGWVKRTNPQTSIRDSLFSTPSGTDDSTLFNLIFLDDKIYVAGSVTGWRLTSAVFRDPSAWYHIVLTVDTTQSTANNRIQLYINGVEVTAFSTLVNPSQNADLGVNNTIGHTIGNYGVTYLNGYLADVHFIDGQALGPEYFGYTDPLTNTWRPKKAKITGPNNGTIWSTGGTLPSGTTPDVFDGNLDTYGLVTSGSTYTLTTQTFTVNNKLEAWFSETNSYYYRFTINGTSYDVYGTGVGEWHEIPVPDGTTVTSFTVRFYPSSGGQLHGIRVDGIDLIDGDTTNFGTNGFYLPFDGSAPIGQDQSGRGNNWTPVNFGGSNTIEKATGALPILNTDGGGKVARVGVRTDAYYDSLVLALPLVGIKSDFSNAVNSGTSNKTITATNAVASSAQSNFYGGSFYFDGTGDYLTVTDDTSTRLGTGDFTVEYWIYYNSVSGNPTPFDKGYTGSSLSENGWVIQNAAAVWYGGGSALLTSPYTDVTGKWYHYAFVRKSGTLTMYRDGIAVTSASDSVDYSYAVDLGIGANIRAGSGFSQFAGAINGYMSDVRIYKGVAKYTSNFIPASTDPDIVPDSPSGVSYSSNLTQITDGAVYFDGTNDSLSIPDSADFTFGSGDFTMEAFVYCNDTSAASHKSIVIKYTTNNPSSSWFWSVYNGLQYFYFYYGLSVVTINSSSFPQSVWVHCAIVREGNTLRMFQDGIQVATGDVTGLTNNDSSVALTIGEDGQNNYDMNGFISNVRVVKGTALYTSNFTPPSAPLTAVANTKLLCCKSNSSATAFDVSPGSITANGNAAATNFNPFTVDIDAVRGKSSGYCTWNPLKKGTATTLSNGNLSMSSGNSWESVFGTIGVSSGKWYWESNPSSSEYMYSGIANESHPTSYYPSQGANSWAYLTSDGKAWYNQTPGTSVQLSTMGSGDTLGIAFDADNGRIWFSKNGVWMQGNPSTGTNAVFTNITTGVTYFPCQDVYGASATTNFGQKPFKFPPPAGFQPLTLANTPRPSIVRPDQYVGVTTFNGTGQGTITTVSNLQFKPDFVWTKSRTGARNHGLYDSVRGVNRKLYSSADFSENTGTTLTSFDNNGFKLADGDDIVYYGESGVAWCWKAGGNSNTFNINDVGYDTASAAGLTAGTITPTGASVNTKSGFSIIGYTGNGSSGATVSHGLGKAPAFVIIKNRDNTGSYNWVVWHQSVSQAIHSSSTFTLSGFTGGLILNGTNPSFTYSFDGQVNGSTEKHIAYCWAEIPGFSKFGSYIGNELADGPVIITGFRPRWVLLKRAVGPIADWVLHDTDRSPYNVSLNRLYANSLVAEVADATMQIDFLSNGFKIRNTGGNVNGSGNTYIYAAFAEAPTFNLYGAQANAR